MTEFNESKLSRIIARRIIAPEDRAAMLPFCTPIYCPNYKGVMASKVTVINPNTNSIFESEGQSLVGVDKVAEGKPSSIDNTFDIEMTIPVSHSYLIPNEVDLETDVNLIDMIKSDFAVRFKKAVSDEILKQAIAMKSQITEITVGSSLVDAVGKAIADNIANGTGQKYSIYKYSNGAPVTYITSSNAPDIDEMVIEKKDDENEIVRSDYASKNDVDVPALYYFEQPTLLLNEDRFTEFKQGLCKGEIKRYAEDVLKVDVTKDDISELGDGLFGSNDSFAVAFTEAAIKTERPKDTFADIVTITVYFGVTNVHTRNLRLFT